MDRLTIGIISKAQGVKGEVKIAPLTDNADRFKKLKSVYIDGISYTVEGVKILPNGIFMSLQGVSDRNTAELLRNKEIRIDRKDAVSLPKDRYFIVDIIGCETFADDKKLGKVVDILQNGAADVYVIADGKKRYMIPAIDRVIKQIDIQNKVILFDKSAWEDLAVCED